MGVPQDVKTPPDNRVDPLAQCSSGSRLIYSRNRLIQNARETIAISQKGSYVNHLGETVVVKDAISKAMEKTIHYHFSHVFPNQPRDLERDESDEKSSNCEVSDSVPTQPRFDTKFRVVIGSLLEIALQLKGVNAGVLNSASGKIPGGRFHKGLLSQEDCICRASLLYPCIAKYEMKFAHFYEINNALPKGTNTACAIFSPRVPIIRRDTPEGELLDRYELYSFVTIPAPNGFVLNTKIKFLKDAMRDRIFRLLSIFAEHACTHLVLSAFGCGVHGNCPSYVAATFHEFLTTAFKGRFEEVIFSIQPSRYENFRAFNKVFKDA